MREPRKVKLIDFARAEARAAEIDRACAKRCGDCPGPGVEGGCETRGKPGMIVGRSDWPVCPRGLTRDPTWRRIVGLYQSALVSPLTGWPRAYRSYVVNGLVQLRSAVREEDARQHEARSSKSGSGLPAYNATRAAAREG